MSNNQSTSNDDSKARSEVISGAAELLAKIVGFSMIVLGLLSLGQVAFGGEDFSMPQAAQGLLGILLLGCAVNGSLKTFLGRFLLDSSNQFKIMMLPVIASFFIFFYRNYFLVSSSEFESYLRTISEGSVVEWSGFVVLIASSFLFFGAAKRWVNSLSRWVLFAASAGVFVIGMEEMSWGQMIFNWDSPALFDQYNIQHETGIHNLWFLHYHTWTIASIVMTLFFVISVISGLLRLAGWVKKRSFADILLPLGCTSTYFLTASIFYWFTVLVKSGIDLGYFHSREQEIGELFFYCGIFIHSMHLYFVSPKIVRPGR